MELYDPESAQRGAIAGAASFVVGLVAAVLVAAPSEGDDLFEVSAMGQSEAIPWEDTSSAPEGWKVAGWLYHEAHFASTDVSMDFSGQPGVSQVDISFAMSPSALLHAAPIVLLLAAGYWVVSADVPEQPADAAVHGAHVVAGYLPLAALSVFLLSWEESGSSSGIQGSMSAQPELVSAVFATGIVFPLVIGAAGGVLAASQAGQEADERPA